MIIIILIIIIIGKKICQRAAQNVLISAKVLRGALTSFSAFSFNFFFFFSATDLAVKELLLPLH